MIDGFILDRKKMPEFLEKPLLSGVGKHTDFPVALCGQNDSTNVNFFQKFNFVFESERFLTNPTVSIFNFF